MTIPVDCPHCETRFQLSLEMAGKSMRCPECREVFVVQSAAAPVEVPPSDDRPFERIEADDFAAPVRDDAPACRSIAPSTRRPSSRWTTT